VRVHVCVCVCVCLPVMAAAAIGETPMLPVTVEGTTFVMPVLARTEKEPAVPRRTMFVEVCGTHSDSEA
jgi:hypothetical protein